MCRVPRPCVPCCMHISAFPAGNGEDVVASVHIYFLQNNNHKKKKTHWNTSADILMICKHRCCCCDEFSAIMRTQMEKTYKIVSTYQSLLLICDFSVCTKPERHFVFCKF